MTTTFYVLKTTGLTGGVTRTWTVPAGRIAVAAQVWGGGGGGGVAAVGGGGGAFSYGGSLTLGPGTVVHYYVGVGGSGTVGLGIQGGGDSWFNGTTLAGSSVGAKGSNTGYNSPGHWTATPAGGAAGSGVGTTKYSGGSGNGGPPI